MDAINEEALTGPDLHEAIGVVAPFDLELDAELWRWLPAGVDLLVTRTPRVDGPVTAEFARAVSSFDDVEQGVRDVTAGRATTVVYACTSGSFVGGKVGAESLEEAMRVAGAKCAITTSGAVVAALHELGMSRVSVATPYLPELSELLVDFLGEYGITVEGHLSLGLGSRIWEASYAEIADLARRADRPDAEAIVLSCTNLPTYDLIAPLERELGKPVVSANQALMWAALRTLGHTARGPGQWLIGHR